MLYPFRELHTGRSLGFNVVETGRICLTQRRYPGPDAGNEAANGNRMTAVFFPAHAPVFITVIRCSQLAMMRDVEPSTVALAIALANARQWLEY